MVTAYVGAISRVGSIRVRQSTTASATPTGTSGSTTSRDQLQPRTSPIAAALTAAASAHFQSSPGRAAMSA